MSSMVYVRFIFFFKLIISLYKPTFTCYYLGLMRMLQLFQRICLIKGQDNVPVCEKSNNMWSLKNMLQERSPLVTLSDKPV